MDTRAGARRTTPSDGFRLGPALVAGSIAIPPAFFLAALGGLTLGVGAIAGAAAWSGLGGRRAWVRAWGTASALCLGLLGLAGVLMALDDPNREPAGIDAPGAAFAAFLIALVVVPELVVVGPLALLAVHLARRKGLAEARPADGARPP